MTYDNDKGRGDKSGKLVSNQGKRLTLDEDSNPVSTGFSAEIYNWSKELVLCVILVVLVFVFVVRIVGVVGTSMLPTLHDDDRVVLLSNVIYNPKAGDIVVLASKDSDELLVKRVIAIEGQTVDINFETHEVWVEGQLQDEPYINEPTAASSDVKFPVSVPEGCIFVMGDNRNASLDSRSSRVGMIDERKVLGKVLLVIYPLNRLGTVS